MVRTGIETFLADSSYHSLFSGKRTALITNYTACTKSFKRTIDVLHEKTNLIKLFAPEHGLHGAIQAGEKVASGVDSKTNIPVFSLYNDSKEIQQTKLEDIDVLAFDVQDAGLRFYTYIYTMANGMKAATEKGIPFVVFDRPNPLGGNLINGNQIDDACASFVGGFGLPQRYGMTMGELARYISVYEKISTPIHIIPLEGWARSMFFEETGLPWVLPSPNLPTPDSVLAYCGTCLIEGTNLSEGRGTTKPMEFIGAPWIHDEEKLTKKLSEYMQEYGIEGLEYRPHKFVPTFSKHKNCLCNGFQIYIDPAIKKRVRILEGIVLMIDLIRNEYHSDFSFCTSQDDDSCFFIDKLSGSSTLREKNVNAYLQEIQQGSQKFCERLMQMKVSDGTPVLLYDGDVIHE